MRAAWRAGVTERQTMDVFKKRIVMCVPLDLFNTSILYEFIIVE
jgi:hypothetical protein